MSSTSHTKTRNTILRLIRQEEAGADELKAAADHILTCGLCLEELQIAAQLAWGETRLPEELDTLLGCSLCRQVLPQYIEAGPNAGPEYGWIAHHLAACSECGEEAETMRWLMAEENVLGPAPMANIRTVIPEQPGQPLINRFINKLRVFWENGQGKVEEIPEDDDRGQGKMGFGLLRTRVLSPAYLGPDDISRQEMTYDLPGGLSVSITVTPANDRFNMVVVPARSGPEMLCVKLFQLINGSPVLVAAEQEYKEDPCSFMELAVGIYRLDIECKIEGQPTIWEIPFELA